MDRPLSHGAEHVARPDLPTIAATDCGVVENAASPPAGESSSIDTPSPQTARRRSRLHVHFSSKSGEWRTPPDLYRRLHNEFRFDLDVAATPANRLIGERPEGWDALDTLAIWGASNYINPPYGREIYRWFQQANWHARDGRQVVLLAPCRPDTRWWDHQVSDADEVRFIKGRLKFLNDAGLEMTSAPFPSCVIVYRPFPQHRSSREPRYSYFRW